MGLRSTIWGTIAPNPPKAEVKVKTHKTSYVCTFICVVFFIKVENISFGYNGQKEILKHFSFGWTGEHLILWEKVVLENLLYSSYLWLINLKGGKSIGKISQFRLLFT